jgi:hypothetical protein
MKNYALQIIFLFLAFSSYSYSKGINNKIEPGKIWYDTDNNPINAHGGGLLYHQNTYYWFGEYRNPKEDGFSTKVGVTCYSSTDLINWKYESVALATSDDPSSEIRTHCIIERPKVIYNKNTKQFVMWFHLELMGNGYEAARTAVAVSNNVNEPYTYLKSYRPNAQTMPLNEQQWTCDSTQQYEWWTPLWREQIKQGLFAQRDFEQGQMSRDMTLFVDDDEKAYHIHSSEDNLTLHISLLTDDYLGFTDQWIRISPGGHNEAPALFKNNGKYYMITSGCTGWAPNEARLFSSRTILGKWQQSENPCKGENAHLTFNSQSSFVLPVAGLKDAFIYWGDRWNQHNLIDSRYVCLPITWENDSPTILWQEQWDLSIFQEQQIQH